MVEGKLSALVEATSKVPSTSSEGVHSCHPGATFDSAADALAGSQKASVAPNKLQQPICIV